MKAKCLMCGKVFKLEQQDDPDDFLSLGKKSSSVSSFCEFCQAKLRKESEDKYKPNKPM